MTPAAMDIRRARQARGWTQRTLAARAEVPQSTIGRIEAGLVDPRASTLDRVLRACGEELGAVHRLGEGVDRSQIREQLQYSPGERLKSLKATAASMERLRRGRFR
jgi:predicted transcriptional regulator